MKRALNASAVLGMTDYVWCYFLIYLPALHPNAKHSVFFQRDCSSAMLSMENNSPNNPIHSTYLSAPLHMTMQEIWPLILARKKSLKLEGIFEKIYIQISSFMLRTLISHMSIASQRKMSHCEATVKVQAFKTNFLIKLLEISMVKLGSVSQFTSIDETLILFFGTETWTLTGNKTQCIANH